MKNKKGLLFSCCLLIVLLQCNVLFAAIRLPAIIGDNMVLQEGMNLPVWGQAEPGEKIEIIFMGKKYKTGADSVGKWLTHIGSYEAGGPYTMVIRGKHDQVSLKNILIGDVWVASGQSNMEFGIQTEVHAADAIANAKDTEIHFFFVPFASSLQPQEDIGPVPPGSANGKWVVCSPEMLSDPKWAWHGFSALGYYFAQQIRATTGKPIGMIGCYKGATPAQAWISIEGLQQSPAFAKYTERHRSLIANYPEAKAAYPAQDSAYEKALNGWNDRVAQAKPSPSQLSTPKPKAPMPPDGGFGAPANLYNAMITPIIKYGIKGVIWYQGESNGDRLPDAIEYKDLFPRLIEDWRKNWKEGDFPFLFVQLPNFRKPAISPSEGIWPWVREAQWKTLSLPNTGMCVISDVGDEANIHPVNKLVPGTRLALAAEHLAYKKDTVYSGPVFRSMKKERATIRLFFDHIDLGLTAKDSLGYGGVLKGFGIAGADKVFVWAKAIIDGNSVVVSCDEVGDPQAVRYNWADNPPGNLYNKDGLPASPFRTDDWPAENNHSN
jgi:sialate O-acetylesterase